MSRDRQYVVRYTRRPHDATRGEYNCNECNSLDVPVKLVGLVPCLPRGLLAHLAGAAQLAAASDRSFGQIAAAGGGLAYER